MAPIVVATTSTTTGATPVVVVNFAGYLVQTGEIGREGRRSGVDEFPSVASEVMPVGLQALDFDLKGFSTYTKTWSMPTSGQIASTYRLFQLGKFLIGDFSTLDISFFFPLSTALRTQVFIHEQYMRPNAISF
ncbi:hypothetical protein Nepgr_007515 [Nepenthes gracilis]|uniref:Uncharacterized protein n=1 Tax=Nepenthes gracilis TaxID=150966 RepID=A0AAD3S769_NEPGR|nr:hypothetical protein Nepgr_007515 [Nepenthes gracilis]